MCRYVIHTVGPRYNIKYKTAAESALFSSYRSVMKIVRFVIVLVFVIFWEIAIVHVHVTVRSGQVSTVLLVKLLSSALQCSNLCYAKPYQDTITRIYLRELPRKLRQILFGLY